MEYMEYAEGMKVLRELRVFAPAIVIYEGRYHVFSRTAWQSSGVTVDAALRAGGFVLPPGWRFRPVAVAVGCNIVRDNVTVASARSATVAKRIANALNEYVSGDRGK